MVRLASLLRNEYTAAVRCNAARLHTDVQPLNTGQFTQTSPTLPNQYEADWFLRLYLKLKLPKEMLTCIEPDLKALGEATVTSIHNLHLQCEAEPPWLEQFDAWGRRVDRIHTSPAWKEQKKISATEGLIAIAYERAYGQYSRLYQMAKLYLYSPSSGLYGCPLAMTDGAAKCISVAGIPDYMRYAYSCLTSRDPDFFWTSGQWMTEKGGGSDVANGTSTIAYAEGDGYYALHGYKWFSSATDADMSLTLARVAAADGSVNEGTAGLSMFFLPTRKDGGDLNNIQIIRLKNKLGTRQLPTAELLLSGTKAQLVGKLGRGVATISDMLTITRLYNSLFASSATRRILELSKAYSMERGAFGRPICQYPLHMRTLAKMELQTQSSTLLTFELARLLGLEESGTATDDSRLLLRLLMPVAKLYTAKVAVGVTSEGLECFGGQGYIEDTGLPAMLRDAQVLPIWEGTTNVLSLDVLRAIEKTKGEVIKAFTTHCQSMLSKCPATSSKNSLLTAIDQLSHYFTNHFATSHNKELLARELSFSIGNIYIGVVFAELSAAYAEEKTLQVSLDRWCAQDLLPVVTAVTSEPDCAVSSEEDWNMTMRPFDK
ncbi:acyl-CoA dehydrogenase family member 11-like [Watersipora subatra]|uniref:acyl-CoA dehydrogenase family member 11-like n=1 Tax=Watersipora subatra TaxID=2589382 RepID=UPI00355ADA5A